MRPPHRARTSGPYGFVPAYSPLARACPKCDAQIGQPCWNQRIHIYPMPMKKYHRERSRPKGES